MKNGLILVSTSHAISRNWLVDVGKRIKDKEKATALLVNSIIGSNQIFGSFKSNQWSVMSVCLLFIGSHSRR